MSYVFFSLNLGAVPLHHVGGICLFFSMFQIFFTPYTDAGNILVYPVDGSHWINMKILLEELHARGHNISVIRTSTTWYITEKSPLYTSITVKSDRDVKALLNDFVQDQMKVQYVDIMAFFYFVFIFIFLYSTVLHSFHFHFRCFKNGLLC